MKFTTGEIAQMLQAELSGDPSIEIDNVAKIEEGQAGCICFLANPKYEAYLYSTQASAVLVKKGFQPKQAISACLIFVDDPYLAFARLLDEVSRSLQQKQGVEEAAYISESAQLGEQLYIGAFAYIGKHAQIGDRVKIYPNAYIGDYAVIGNDTVVYPNASIYYGCRVGKKCIIHAGAVLGSDGFGFAPQKDQSYLKIPQVGIVVLEDEVEVGANTSIDRATMGATIIRKGTKLDNLVQIAHNVEVGANTVIAAQAGVSGSTKLGKHCMVGGQVGIVGHIELANQTQIGAQSGVSKNVKQEGMVLRGSPAQELRKQLKAEALLRQLDQMRKQSREMQKRIEQLEQQIQS